jgi:hypothetical protein
MTGQWKYFIVTLIIGWCLGAASGCLIAHICHMRIPTGSRNRFYRKLDLTPEQRSQADVILDKSRQRLDQLFADFRPKVEDIRRSTHDEIRALLTPEQQIKFDRFNSKWEAKFWERFNSIYRIRQESKS